VKTIHLADMRAHYAKNLGVATFDEAFTIMAKAGQLSQQDIIMNYLWHFKHDDYSWHLRNALQSKHQALNVRMNIFKYQFYYY
jgi:hypothetical protein